MLARCFSVTAVLAVLLSALSPVTAQQQRSFGRLPAWAEESGVTLIRALPLYSELSLTAGARTGAGLQNGPTIVSSSLIFEQFAQRTMQGFGDPETARRWVIREALAGTRWIKVYNSMDEDSLTAIVDEAHSRGMKVCGHATSVPPHRAAMLGQDTLEHIVDFPLSSLADGALLDQSSSLGARIGWLWDHVDEQRADALLETFVRQGTGWVPTLVVIEQMLNVGGHDGSSLSGAAERELLDQALTREALSRPCSPAPAAVPCPRRSALLPRRRFRLARSPST
jgi:hypothetical protein